MNDVLVILGVDDRSLLPIDFIGGEGTNQVFVVGSSGDDAFTITEADNTLQIESNVVAVTSSGVNSLAIIAGSGNDSIDASGVASITLSLYGGDDDDTVVGGAANDFILDEAGNNTLQGGAGNDQIIGGSGIDLIDGQDGDDRLEGGDGDDNIRGGLGDDYLRGGFGVDILDGGEGINELIDD